MSERGGKKGGGGEGCEVIKRRSTILTIVFLEAMSQRLIIDTSMHPKARPYGYII